MAKKAIQAMTRENITAQLANVKTWQMALAEPREAFCKEMNGRQYGLFPVVICLGMVFSWLEC